MTNISILIFFSAGGKRKEKAKAQEERDRSWRSQVSHDNIQIITSYSIQFLCCLPWARSCNFVLPVLRKPKGRPKKSAPGDGGEADAEGDGSEAPTDAAAPPPVPAAGEAAEAGATETPTAKPKPKRK